MHYNTVAAGGTLIDLMEKFKERHLNTRQVGLRYCYVQLSLHVAVL